MYASAPDARLLEIRPASLPALFLGTPDPMDWTSDQLAEGVALAITDRDFQAVDAFLKLMAIRDPDRAREIYDGMKAVTEACREDDDA